MSKVAEVLQALQEERRHLSAELSRVERAIAAIEEAMGGERTLVAPRAAETAPAPPPPSPPAEKGPYSMLHFNEAAAQYLASVNEPKSAREIADALRAGGFPTKSKDFAASVRTMLNRLTSYDGIEHMNDGKWRFVGRSAHSGD